MRYLTKDYVTGEILDTISLMQLNKESVPNLQTIQIEDIAERFIFDWKEVGDYEADFGRTLLEFLRNEFIYNKINYTFNG
jgi:hypothetical protein